MARVAVVTDTSSDLLPEQAAALGIRLVPLTVSFGDASFEAVTELSNEDFYERLTTPGAPFPRTAAPNPSAFEAAYREALEASVEAVFCVTISQRMSATHAAALKAAEAFDARRVAVMDSLTTTHGLGLIARAAARRAAGGASLEDVVAEARDVRDRSGIYFVLDTLEYLQRGGRIGRASALLGTVLAIKPILKVEEGVVATADKRRTMTKARARLLELLREHTVERVVVVHTMTPGVERFRDEVAEATGLPSKAIEIGLTGPVAGSHVGPGVLGVCSVATSRGR